MNNTQTHTMNYTVKEKEAHSYERGVITHGQYRVCVSIEKFSKNWEYFARVWFLHTDGLQEEKTVFVGSEPRKHESLRVVLSKASNFINTQI